MNKSTVQSPMVWYKNWTTGNTRTGGHNPNYCIIEIDQNTEKSPGDLRRLVVAQISVKDH